MAITRKVTQQYVESESKFQEVLTGMASVATYSGRMIDKYTLLDDSYRASGGFETGDYLIPHPSEKDDKYIRRKNMSYFINYVKPVVDAHVNPIFKNKPIRKNLSSTYSRFIEDVDGNGTTLTRFMKKAAIRAKLHGVEFIVIDMEKLSDGQIVTEKDVLDGRLFPYLYLVSPKQITKWSLDKFGKLVYISYSITNNVIDERGDIKTVNEIWTWTNTVCTKSIDGIEEKFQNPVGMIPIVPLYGAINDSSELMPQSDVFAIAKTNFALYNACSELRERNRAQAFSLLTYPISEDDDYDNGDEPIRYGTADVIMYKGTSSKAPMFITPPADSSDIIMDEINFCIKEIYRMANLQLTTGVNQYNVSGLAKEWDSMQLFQTIEELAQGLQEAEYKISKVFSKYMGETMEKISVAYNNQYGILDSTTVLTNATQALALDICGKYNEAMKEQVIRSTLKDIDNNIVEEIILDLQQDESAEEPIDPESAKVVQPSASR